MSHYTVDHTVDWTIAHSRITARIATHPAFRRLCTASTNRRVIALADLILSDLGLPGAYRPNVLGAAQNARAARRITCAIVYRLNGRLRRWTIGALYGVDNDVTLSKHLARFIPDATFVKARWRRPSVAGIDQVVHAERQACAAAICASCREGEKLIDTEFGPWRHINWDDGSYVLCPAASIHARGKP